MVGRTGEQASVGNASLCAFSASSSRIRTLCFVRPITPFVKRFQPQTAIAAHTPARRPPQTRDRQSRSCAPSVIGRWSVNAIPIVRTSTSRQIAIDVVMCAMIQKENLPFQGGYREPQSPANFLLQHLSSGSPRQTQSTRLVP